MCYIVCACLQASLHVHLMFIWLYIYCDTYKLIIYAYTMYFICYLVIKHSMHNTHHASGQISEYLLVQVGDIY